MFDEKTPFDLEEESQFTDEFAFEEDPRFRPWGMELKQYCMFMHFAQLASFIIPLAGLILPIVMWSTHKEQSRLIDAHGKNIVNWIISSTIYMFASVILIFILVGIPLLIAVAICSTVFAVIGGIKANEGKIYEYPFTITFIK